MCIYVFRIQVEKTGVQTSCFEHFFFFVIYWFLFEIFILQGTLNVKRQKKQTKQHKKDKKLLQQTRIYVDRKYLS